MSSPIKTLKMKKFLSLLGDRQAKFAVGSPELPDGTDSSRALARSLHPKKQYLKVVGIIQRGEDCSSFELAPDPERGTSELAYFGAGKYLSVFETIDSMPVTRAYSISSAPSASLEGRYELTIRRNPGGLMSNHILDTWQIGTQVTVSAPSGNFEYQPLRDADTVVAVAGGSGITPFMSMAGAIADGDEDFDVTVASSGIQS